MKKLILVFLLILIAALPLIAQEKAVIREFSGKVEIQSPGKGWVSAQKGMEISKGTVISTGFNATASLDLGSSELFVKQLTRMTLDELVRQEGKVTTSLSLKVGKVRAKVKTSEGLTHDFKLRSPTSTASVRGTEFEYDGFTVKVSEGTVSLADVSGKEELVFEGESSGGETALSTGFAVSPYSEFSGEGGGGITDEVDADASGFTGSVVITVN